MTTQLDEIGPWSEIKLEIIKKYAKAYNTILSRKWPDWPRVYIDAVSGAGTHLSKLSGGFILGSPLNALLLDPPFTDHHFIDINGDKIKLLSEYVSHRSDVTTYTGDSNDILINEVFPKVKYKDFRRGLCLLDPYGLHLDWRVIATAGEMKSIEIFLNFPTMDINMNVLKKDRSKVAPQQEERLTRSWGDKSWQKIAYETRGNLFGFEENVSNEKFAFAYRDRLKNHAGFAHVPDPIPMKNQTGSTIYYIFFASHQPVAADIVQDIFNKYRDRM